MLILQKFTEDQIYLGEYVFQHDPYFPPAPPYLDVVLLSSFPFSNADEIRSWLKGLVNQVVIQKN